MPYEIKPLSCDPKKLKGLSEKLIVSHWENNDEEMIANWTNVARLHQAHAR